MSNTISETWIVVIPGDETRSHSFEELASIAIDEARDLAPDYVMPAHWSAVLTDGPFQAGEDVTFEVTRTHFGRPCGGLDKGR